jgi:hypothetical protein
MAVAVVLVFAAAVAVPAGAAKTAATTKCADPSGTVKVGLSYFGGVAQNLGDIGAGDVGALDPGAQAIINGYKGGIAALNAAGGLAGCQVAPVFFNFSAQSPDFNQESQQECAAFTQDNKVIAVFTAGFETKVAVDCFAKAKTPLFSYAGSYQPSCADLKKYAGYVYLPIGVATCRYGSFVNLWNKAGLFPKDAKVGILALDDGSGQGQYVADKVYAPALKKLKIPSESFSFPSATSGAAFSATNSAMGAAILKFKSDGVNVVIMTPAGAQAPAAFLPQAATQGFFPNYGFSSSDALVIVNSLGASAVKKGIAISWLIGDLPLTAQQALPPNPAIEGCAPWSTSTPNVLTLTGSSSYCDFLNILQAGFKNATKTDPASLKKGIEALGTSFVSSMTYGGKSKFGKGDYDGITAAQMLKFDPPSKSWEYVSPSQKATAIP